MPRVRSFLAALGRDELSVTTRTILGAVAVFVPFGSIVLLTRWTPVRRALQKLGHPCHVGLDPGEAPGQGRGEVPQACDICDWRGTAVEGEEHEVDEVQPPR